MGFQVVGIVIPGGQSVSAYQNPTFHLGAKALGTGAGVHIHQILRIFAAVAVTHPVKTGQVGGGLRRRNHVIGGNRKPGVRQGYLFHGGAQFLVFCYRIANLLLHRRAELVTEILLGQANLQAF